MWDHYEFESVAPQFCIFRHRIGSRQRAARHAERWNQYEAHEKRAGDGAEGIRRVASPARASDPVGRQCHHSHNGRQGAAHADSRDDHQRERKSPRERAKVSVHPGKGRGGMREGKCCGQTQQQDGAFELRV